MKPRRRQSGPRLAAAIAVAVVLAAGFVLTARLQSGGSPAVVLPPLPKLDQAGETLRRRLEEAHAAASRDPGAPEPLAALGRLLHANGFAAEAEACWLALSQAQPRQARWPYYHADLRRIQGDDAAMRELLARTVQLDREYAPAWLQLAEHDFKTGNPGAARDAYERRLALVAADPYARLGLARIAQLEGRTAESRRLVAQLVADVPEFPSARNLHAELLAAAGEQAAAERERLLGVAAGRFRAAADPWLDALLEDCLDYERLCVRGVTEILTGQAELGKARLERARSLRPDAFPAYELLGNLYLDAGDAAQAVQWYEQGLAAAPSAQPSVHFHVNLARAHRLVGQPATAVRVLRDGLAVVGECFELQDALGVALAELSQPAAALAAHRRAVELNPAHADTTYHLALALIAADRLEEAVAELRRSHTTNPSHPATLALLGQIEMDSGRWLSAVRYLEPLFAAQPELPEAREKMTLVRLRAGEEAERGSDLAQAEAHYRAGLQIQPDHADLLARLGLLLLRDGRAPETIVLLETHDRRSPRHATTVLLLARAYATAGRPADARRLIQERIAQTQAGDDPAIVDRLHDLLRRLPR